MQYVKDFIHEEHPILIFNEENHDEKPKLCKLCGFLMFADNPFYSCSISGCGVFLHKHCAELPVEFNNEVAFSGEYNPFTLLPSPTSEGCKCLKCDQICKSYMYWPKGTLHQNAGLHPLCAFPNELGTLHRSHRYHPLSPTHREISAVCSACGEQQHGIFFSCQKCDYWLHQDCASLPPLAKHSSHHHELALLYSYPFPIGKTSWGSCKICHEDMPLKQGVYTCRACNYGAHLKCLKSSIMVLTPKELKKLITYLPPSVEDTVFPSLIIQAASLELEEPNETSSSTVAKRMTPNECHDHPLIFHKNHNNEISGEAALCNACVQPILSSTSYYSCSKIDHCHFLVHELCANLPKKILGKLLDTQINLFTKWSRGFFDVFQCAFCRRPCNGFGYSTGDAVSVVDVECASAPRIIKHESHKDHILHLTTLPDSKSSAPGDFGCCSKRGFYIGRRFYQCISCNFKIHISCALLPQQVEHKFDKHPLQLNTNGPTILLQQRSSSDNFKPENYNFCEFCEKDINLNFWFYSCLEGDQYFHVDCIPCVGKFSKFKFGGTIDHVRCHADHPLKSVRMLMVGSQRCGLCKATVQGFNDDYAFHCFTCDFWMHESCAYHKTLLYRYFGIRCITSSVCEIHFAANPTIHD